ncbi:hypothetical protein [Simiduia agarivorans]|uniref:Uncharacterized protein n=1 Tax=Simiduia agarivorans (strain DSM 21679 / JCM 13881 / BCRC 17597 / SA1) TaxID=1117647 RepID=K4KPG9_SIMAS|nr:hypothetical protein [Simiduia agarivorans]AFV00131.1 hypothetical protein M5M_14980 [Simiduia agarivorans SA1 = DSM 21679]
MINNFSDLLAIAATQPDAQRLLLLFANAEVEDHDNAEIRGTLSPVMCVDKLPAQLTDFSTLVKEADGVSTGWNMVFVAGLAGKGKVPPTEKDAEPYLNQMTSDLRTGQDLSRYLVFDRDEQLVSFG